MVFDRPAMNVTGTSIAVFDNQWIVVLNKGGNVTAHSKLLTADLLRESVKWEERRLSSLKNDNASQRFTRYNGQLDVYWLKQICRVCFCGLRSRLFFLLGSSDTLHQ